MKLIIFIISILSFLGNQPREKDLNYSDFKIGKFELVNKESNKKYIFHRNKVFQTEESFDLKTGKKLNGPRFFLIEWNTDSTYNLLVDTSKTEYDAVDLYLNSIGGLNNKITKIEGSCATVVTFNEIINVESKICKLN